MGDYAFPSFCLSVWIFVCMSVRTRNSKTVAPIELIFLHKNYYARGSVLFKDDRDPDLDSIKMDS